MQKVLFSLPLVGVVLSACSATSPAPVVHADTSELSPGIMQPVGANPQAGWQTAVQNTPMPPSMAPVPMPQPNYIPPQPVYQPIPQPVAAAPTQPQPVASSAPKATTKSAPQDFTIPRDAKNAPIYSQINKGFYNGETYTVRKGDTMFLIAYIAGKDVKELAKLNNMSEPYQLHIGQVVKLSSAMEQQVVHTAPNVTAPAAPPKPEVTYTQAPNGTAYGSDGTVTGPVKAGVSTTPPRPGATANVGTRTTSTHPQASAMSSLGWQWPTQGRVIAGFSSADGGNKGLDIAGNKGQPVNAAAAGKVVYAGNALEGYGNLIIIKHNDEFMSAYAHNDSIKIKEQDNVRAGQTIATLGSTGTNGNKLHFEIRYLGKSVDPMLYLPKR